MMLECYDHRTGQDWTGELKIVASKEGYYELFISGRVSFHHIIVAKHAYGAVLCIRKLGISCELATLGDTFWNRESLASVLSTVDAIIIAEVLSYLTDFD